MISCTEFIPAYSELFTYLENKSGRAEVDKFWDYLFQPTGDGIPLINYLKNEGIRGCYSYWASTLNEEAADFTMYLNEKAGWFVSIMNHCPSKGRLLKLQDEIGITPYHDYCLHCAYYRKSIEKIGLKYHYNFIGIDHASCSEMVYDPKIFNGNIVIDENTIIMKRVAEDNEYFHPDFHSSMNMGIHYVGENYGLRGITEYLEQYTKNVYRNVIADIKSNGLSAVKRMIEDTYAKEKALDALDITYCDDSMIVKINYCPAIRHLKSTNRVISPWYRYTTEIVMSYLSRETNLVFNMMSYNEDNGAATYSFKKG